MPEKVPQPHGGAINRAVKGDVLNPHGRPRKVISKIIAQLKHDGYQRVTKGRVIEAYELLMGLDEGKLKSIQADKEEPMILRIVAKELLNDKGGQMVETMLSRAHGKPDQNVNDDMTVKHVVITKKDPKQIKGAEVIDLDYDNSDQLVSSTSRAEEDS